MTPPLRVIPGPGSRWLLYASGRCFLIPSQLGRLIAGDGRGLGAAGVGAPLAALIARTTAPRRRPRRMLWVRFTIVPGVWTDHLAQRLAPLASWPFLIGQAVAGIVCLFVARPGAAGIGLPGIGLPDEGGGSGWLAVAAGFLATAFWHECGHAAALRREGQRSGGIGAGLLLCLPVLYCDVTALALLGRRGRLRVDLSGVCFQLAAGGLLSAAGCTLAVPALCAAGLLAALAVSWSLQPFVRSDGHWALADLIGVGNLAAPLRRGDPDAWPRPASSRSLAAFLVLFRGLESLFLFAVAVLLPWRLAGRWHLQELAGRLCGESAGLIVWAALLLPGTWLAGRLIRRIGRLWCANASDLRIAAGLRPR